ncbi:hypothetical protein [Alloactinosynnema sp. L-07]|uniref:hypothetical protein n=1 Tax=Alloactinosynnema sp. L-07 TaxID=1653480 RepID=UPI0006B690CA|nr:hypothetical protein [Alloactinosynnema sp. L-07]
MPENTHTTSATLRADLDIASGLANGREDALQDVRDAARGVYAGLLAAVDDLPALLAKSPAATADKVTAALTGPLAATRDLVHRADGYTGLNQRDMVYPDITAELDSHHWSEQPGSTADANPSVRHERGWLRTFHRGAHVLNLWFTSPTSLAAAALSGRGPLRDTREVKAAITSRDTPGPLHVPFQWPRGKDTATTNDMTWEEATSYLHTYGFTLTASSLCDANGVPDPDSDGGRQVHTWIKPDARRTAPVSVRLYERAADRPVAWYWAGRISCLPQLYRICVR